MGIGVWGFEFGVWGLGFGVWGVGFGVWGLGVWGLGFGVQGLPSDSKGRASAILRLRDDAECADLRHKFDHQFDHQIHSFPPSPHTLHGFDGEGTALEVTQGQILGQSRRYATRFWWHLYWNGLKEPSICPCNASGWLCDLPPEVRAVDGARCVYQGSPRIWSI